MVKIEKVDVYVCPECYQEHEDEQDAIDCCPPDIICEVRFKCSECGELCETEQEAEECCEEEE